MEYKTLDGKEFDVKYRLSGISESQAANVEKMIQVFRDLAVAFKVNISVDYSGGPATIHEDKDEKREINFHIDSFPSRFRPIAAVEAYSIFGLVPSEPIMIRIAVPTKAAPQYRLPKTELYSPEGHPIGYILGSHIFIYQNVLTSEAWANEDNLRLLKIIAYWFLPKVMRNIFPDDQEKVRNGLHTIRAEFRGLYLPVFPKRDEFKKKFAVFVSSLNSKALAGLEEKATEIEQKLERLSAEYFESMGQYTQNLSRLEMIRKDISARDFEKEFEAIMIMDSIETVRVADDRYLVIKTGPVSQIPETTESYDIGEFTIRIDTVPTQTFLNHSAIKFHQDGYLGRFKHPHISSFSEICFGNASQLDNIGLNPIIDNFMSRFDTVPLVHLILTFMKKERSRPTLREINDIGTLRTDNYTSPEERQDEKNKFVKLVSATVLKSSLGQLEKLTSELRQKISSLHSEIINEGALLNDYRAILDKMNAFLVDKDSINREAERFLNDTAIFGLFISERELLIYLHQPREDQPATNYLPENSILKFESESFPKLLIPSSKRWLQIIPLVDPGRLKQGEISTDDEIMMTRLHLGQISDIVGATKRKLEEGYFDPKIKTWDKKEAKNE